MRGGISGELVMFSFLIWVLGGWVCGLQGISTLRMCVPPLHLICFNFCINILMPSLYKPAGAMLGLIREEQDYIQEELHELASIYWQE